MELVEIFSVYGFPGAYNASFADFPQEYANEGIYLAALN